MSVDVQTTELPCSILDFDIFARQQPGAAAAFEPVHDIIAAQRDAVAGIITPEGLQTLKLYIPHLNRLGWVAIDGIYHQDWVQMVNSKREFMDTDPKLEASALHPLFKLFSALSDLAYEAKTGSVDSGIEYIEDETKEMHADVNDGHTFLSNFRKVGVWHYVFRSYEGTRPIDRAVRMLPNQLVIIGGAAIHKATAFTSVEHAAEPLPRDQPRTKRSSRMRFMTFAEREGKYPPKNPGPAEVAKLI